MSLDQKLHGGMNDAVLSFSDLYVNSKEGSTLAFVKTEEKENNAQFRTIMFLSLRN